MSQNEPHAAHDGQDLEELRETIDELKAIPEDELVSPVPSKLLQEEELTPEPTDAIGSEEWQEPEDETRS